jgi:hypothetical protein
MDLDEHIPNKVKLGDEEMELNVDGGGALYIETRIWLHDRTRMMDAAAGSADSSALKVGQRVSVYVGPSARAMTMLRSPVCFLSS